MKKDKNITKLNDTLFKRLIGVKKDTYNIMVNIFKQYEKERIKNHGIGGRKQSLCE